MPQHLPSVPGAGSSTGWRRRTFAALTLAAGLASSAVAQPPAPGAGAVAQAPTPGARETASPLPPVPARPIENATNFAGPLSTNDATIEIPVNQARILNLREDVPRPPGAIAIGDPSVVLMTILNTRQIRLLGNHLGVTDLNIVTADGRVYSFEIHVVAELDPLRLQLRALFPDATLRLTQVRDNIVVEGEARDVVEVGQIVGTIRAYVNSVFTSELRRISATTRVPGVGGPGAPGVGPATPGGGAPGTTPRTPGGEVPVPIPVPTQPSMTPPLQGVSPELAPPASVEATVREPLVINLIRVPGSQQVLLKVRFAELDRAAMRQIGGSFLAVDHDTGAIVGTGIGGAPTSAVATITGGFLSGLASQTNGPGTTIFGIFQKGDFDIMLNALRTNNIMKILAEPNLVAMNGHQASFLAGGEYPVPVAQPGTGGGGAAVSVTFKEFGVRLGFLPYIIDDDTIRLTVDPEVSSINEALATTLVPGGTPTPGLNSRKAHTTVELHQGQTLAIAGLLQLNLAGNTQRIPGLGDLPIIGPMFSNTTSDRTELELIVLVTPYLVEPMNADQVPPSTGDEVKEPTDLEFFFLNRIEGRTGRDFRSTVKYDDPFHIVRCLIRTEQDHVSGPHGFCQ